MTEKEAGFVSTIKRLGGMGRALGGSRRSMKGTADLGDMVQTRGSMLSGSGDLTRAEQNVVRSTPYAQLPKALKEQLEGWKSLGSQHAGDYVSKAWTAAPPAALAVGALSRGSTDSITDAEGNPQDWDDEAEANIRRKLGISDGASTIETPGTDGKSPSEQSAKPNALSESIKKYDWSKGAEYGAYGGAGGAVLSRLMGALSGEQSIDRDIGMGIVGMLAGGAYQANQQGMLGKKIDWGKLLGRKQASDNHEGMKRILRSRASRGK